MPLLICMVREEWQWDPPELLFGEKKGIGARLSCYYASTANRGAQLPPVR